REAIRLWDEALELWRGEPFAGIEAPVLSELGRTLTEERFAAELDRVDALLRIGQHAGVLPWLHQRTEQLPFDERLAGQLMLALHRHGDSAAALDHAEALAARLAVERGSDPGPALRALWDRIRADTG